MNIRKFLAGILLLAASVATAQQMAIPVDPAVRMGELPNGLHYYIRQNGWPEHRVNFYIAQRVGSIQENDDQRGLAHFLEHMAFNGSDHFKDNNLIEYTRSLGVEFGGDLNAYTGIDQTVYRICNVPSNRLTALDSCLLILKDWSNGLTLNKKEIEKERGVIHEEWRLRTSPMMRILERNLEKLYPGSKYGVRMPIGKMEIVDNFKPKVLRKYYQKWYRPDNQAIIVVGDIDVDRTEAKIKELFSPIKLQANAAQVVEEPVPDNDEPIIIIDKDKEQQMNYISISFKHDATPRQEKTDVMYLVQQYAVNMATTMLNSRYGEAAQQEGCPFVSASCSDGPYILAKTKEAFSIDIMPKDGQDTEAISAAMREALRASEFGFTETEYARARAEYLSQIEKVYTNRNKRDNAVYGDALRDYYLENEPIPSIEDEYQLMNALAPNIPVEAINQLIQELVSTSDKNLVVLSINNEKEGAVYPTPQTIKQAIDQVQEEQLEPYVDNVKDEPLISELPQPGKIVSEKQNKKLGFTELTLSNGARVILKKTDYKEDEVRMSATSKGGSSLLPDADIVNAKLAGSVLSASGLGNFDNTELEKALAGKQASVNFQLANLHEMVNGSSTPKDLETLFQLNYLTFTNVKKDEKAFNTLVNMLENALKNKDLSPEQAFQDSAVVTLYNHNPRFGSMNIDDLKQLNYDRVLQIVKERLQNAADFTFFFVGNFDEQAIRPLIEQYIASLPGDPKQKEDWKPVTTYTKGLVENSFRRKMETPKANAYFYWFNTQTPYTTENAIKADAAGQVLEMIYLKEIREDASAAYSANAAGVARGGGDVPFTCIFGAVPMKPEKADLALEIMEKEARGLCDKVDADMLTKVKELMLKQADDNAKRNGYWMNILTTFDEQGIDEHTDFKRLVNALTPQSVQQFMRDVIFAAGNEVKVVMMPEE